MNSENVNTNLKPKISVIAPVYNVEKWLQRCFDSLIAQTFTDFDVWLVDDGSTDNSGKICDSFAEKDSRFHVIHQKNGGAAAARNAAFPHAKGEYFYFMDPDDWCEKTMLADMYSFAKNNNLQLAICGYYIDTYYSEDKYYQETRTAPDKIYATKEEFRQDSYKLFDEQLLYTPWNKLYKRDYLINKNIKFPATFWDDLPFNLFVIENIERVGCLNKRYYHFLRARQEAENTKYRPDMFDKREEEDTWLRSLYKYWKINDENTNEFLDRRYSERLIGCIENLTCKNCTLSSKEKKQQIKSMISTVHAQKAIRNTKPNSFMMKVMLFPLKHKLTWLTYIESKFISFVKRNNTKLFATLKANR